MYLFMYIYINIYNMIYKISIYYLLYRCDRCREETAFHFIG